MHDFWTKLGALLLPGVVLALVVGGLIAICISTARGAERAPGEWLDDNKEYGEAITFTIPTDSQTIDIDDLLARCLEFLRDGDIDQSMTLEYAVYRPHTLKGDAMDAIEAAQNELARLEKETQLRRDIERALAALRGEK